MPVAGIDIGGTTTKLALVGPDGKIEGLRTIPTAPGHAPEFVSRLGAAFHEAKWPAERVGVAVAGFVSGAHDAVAYNPNLPWLEHFPLRTSLEQALGLPVMLEADSNAATLAEWRWGAGRSSDRFLCLTAGTGLGGGMLVGGELLRYAYEGLGDVGHVIVAPGGKLCSCGGKGCAEALIGANAIANRFRDAGGSATGLREVIEQAFARNSLAVRLIEDAGRWLGLALSTLANILFPDRIAIAGGLSEAGDLLLEPCRAAFRENASGLASQHARIVKAGLGWQATLAGAGACATLDA
jgi:glucokinase